MASRIGCGSAKDKTKADEAYAVIIVFDDGYDEVYTVTASGQDEAEDLARDIAFDDGREIRQAIVRLA